MSKNKAVKEQMQFLYGSRCMLTGVYSNNPTYHHILKKQWGGKETVENGSLLVWRVHEWLHEQEDNETYDLVNECLLLYKICLDENRKELIDQFNNEVMPLFRKLVKVSNMKNSKLIEHFIQEDETFIKLCQRQSSCNGCKYEYICETLLKKKEAENGRDKSKQNKKLPNSRL